jgi:hypothetical protein
VNSLRTGDEVPAGTAAGGGFSFGLTRLGYDGSMVAYFLQKPGGEVLISDGPNYTSHPFLGKPAEFIKAAKEKLGLDVELHFKDYLAGTPLAVTRTEIVKDTNGESRLEVLTLEDRSQVIRWIQGSSQSWITT